jgi:Tfp pilus assembly protein PilO
MESIATKAVVGLPTMWRVITVIGSIASTIILVVVTFAFNLVQDEWKELRAEVKEMRNQINDLPDGASLRRLADDVQDIGRRVDRIETQINQWDE